MAKVKVSAGFTAHLIWSSSSKLLLLLAEFSSLQLQEILAFFLSVGPLSALHGHWHSFLALWLLPSSKPATENPSHEIPLTPGISFFRKKPDGSLLLFFTFLIPRIETSGA